MATVQTSSHLSAPKLTASGSPIRPSDGNTITDFTEWLQSAGKKPKTVATYHEASTALAAYTAKKGMPLLEQITREHIEDYIGSLRQRGNRHSTIRNRQASLRALFAWMIDENIRKDHPMDRIALEKIPEQVLPHYADDEVLALLNAIPNRAKDVLALRDRALILFLLDTGMRGQETCDIRLGAVDREAHQVTVVAGKNDKQRVVRYNAYTGTSITRYIRSRGGWELLGHAAPLFADRRGERLTIGALRGLLQRRFAKAGIEFRGIHAFRRSFAISFLESDGSALDLMVLAGWSSWSMVHKYTRATARSRSLAAHEAHSPVTRLMQKGRTRG